ncbi:MAG: DUF4123 domain-containing protein [Rubrivivax sp.]
MADEDRQAALQAALWPDGPRGPSVWAVLDGARDPKIHLALIESRLEVRSLFAGPLPRELEMASPQLVELLPGHRLTAKLLGEAWGGSWGVFVRTNDAADLRLQLRKLLRVKIEGGGYMLLRWYDPRVLTMFLPTCDTEQLRQMFAGVEAYVCEAEMGRAFSSFALRQGKLQAKTSAL